MDQNKSPLERAFELARSGRYSSTADVKKAVAAEGYATDQLTGNSLSRQIKEIMNDARTAETKSR